MNAPNLPDVARAIIKGLIVQADADNVIALLGLRDA